MANPARTELALAQYRLRARFYDNELAAFEPIRRRAIACLTLRPGDTVLDAGCGTGLSFEPLLALVGPSGHVLGVEQSPEMAELARQRIDQHGWRNVTVVQTSADTAQCGPYQPAAVLFHFTHDILSNPGALNNLLFQLKPGASVVAAGLQWSAPWDWVTNMLVLGAAMYSVTNLDALDQPCRLLVPLCDDIQRDPSPMAGTYIVHTRLRRNPQPAQK